MRQHGVALVLAMLALSCMGAAIWHLERAGAGVRREAVAIGHIPATIFRPAASSAAAPAIVIAHGFAGSQQLMQSFALTFARNGYIAVTFDFAGHGRNPQPMTGDITREDGATQKLAAETGEVLRIARSLGDGRVALLGHSMASDIVVRTALLNPDVAATIAVSMFSPAVTASTPRNLLVLAGGWEGFLQDEALRAVNLAIAPGVAQPGVTYGNFGDGSARRAAFIANAEHVSVLFRPGGLAEALDWLDRSFAITRVDKPVLAVRGAWLALLFGGIALLLQPASLLLPQISVVPLGAGLSGRALLLPILIPALATPLVLRLVPTHFLPVLVGDYLAIHFAVYGALTFACLRLQGFPLAPSLTSVWTTKFAVATLGLLAFYAVGVFVPLDRYFTSFMPSASRLVLICAMAAGTLAFFMADEWMTRGQVAPWWSYALSKIAFLLSLSVAVALDFERLFFLVIIIPAVLLFFAFFGLVSNLTYRRTRHPWVAGVGNAFALATALGVVFPLVAG